MSKLFFIISHPRPKTVSPGERMKKNTLWGVFLNERRGSEVPAHFAPRMRKPEPCANEMSTGEVGSGRLASDERSEGARLSDRDRILVPEPRKTKQDKRNL